MVNRLRPIVPYHLAIQGYSRRSPTKLLAEVFLNELFSSAEAMALEEYIDERVGIRTEVEEVELPVPIRFARPLSAIPLESGMGWWEIYHAEDYPLPFNVAGYFDARPLLDHGITWEEALLPRIHLM
jgi:hypothetical protein